MIARLRNKDRGATLILVLIIVSVISAVMSVVLANAETNVRATEVLRDQASANYSADGAADAMLTVLKTAGVNCSTPANSTYNTPLGSVSSPFYSPISGQDGPMNAYAQCTLDQVHGMSQTVSVSASTSFSTPPPVVSTSPFLGQGDSTLPTYAVLTTGTATSGGGTDFGLDLSGSANNTTIYTENGSIGSKSDVNATNQCLVVRLSENGGDTSSNCNQISNFGSGVDGATATSLVVKAAGRCLGEATAFRPTSCQAGASDVAIPAAPSLTTTSSTPANPVCGTSGKTTYAALSPGYYDSSQLSKLNTPCGSIGTNALVEWLMPGAYFFNYGSQQWTWPSVLVAGTPTTNAAGTLVSGLTPVTSTSVLKLSQLGAAPNACADPANAVSESGVTMVFGGASTVGANTTQGNYAQICASSPSGSPAQPPVAIYGLTQPLTLSGSGAFSATVPAETLCTANGCGGSGSSGTSLINTSFGNNSGHASVYIKGYVYAPQAQLLLRLYNAAGQIFNWGVIVRNLALVLNGSSPTQPVFKLPRPNTGIGTVVTTSTPAPSPIATSATATITTYTIRYVNVWTCTVASLQAAGLSQCPHTGTPNVQLRVLTDPSGVPQKILSWSHIRG